jgi:hypothetical protein
VSTLSTPKRLRSNLNSLNTFIKETSSNTIKLSKVGSNAIVPVPVEAGPNKLTSLFSPFLKVCWRYGFHYYGKFSLCKFISSGMKWEHDGNKVKIILYYII